MTIKMDRFGKMLISRPAGREAFLVTKAYILSDKQEPLELDFADVAVLAPSWADEFISGLKTITKDIKYINTDNASVKSTLEIIGK
ncbi:MAG: hypothetical protein ACD_58C00297G0006 [uncultured bacterium]|nr:MAG: hypothetical protein ACD_58C00297G0006 [uncultured bacterium]